MRLTHDSSMSRGFVSHSWKVVTIDSRDRIPRLVCLGFCGGDGLLICFTFVEGCHRRIHRQGFGRKPELRFSWGIAVSNCVRIIYPLSICFTFVEGCHHRIGRQSIERKLELRLFGRIVDIDSRAHVSPTFYLFHIRGRLSPFNYAYRVRLRVRVSILDANQGLR